MLSTNKEKLVAISVQGTVGPPSFTGFRIGAGGEPVVPLGIGGIIYNVRVGDPAFGWVGDHVEPGVSVRNADEQQNTALVMLNCVGNTARVMSGRAAGAEGIVTGQHGHVLCHFALDVMKKMAPGDVVVVEALGYGLKIDQFPEIVIKNTSPRLLESMGMTVHKRKLRVPVVAVVPSHLFGSGIELPSERADVDLMSADRELMKELKLDSLRLGDVVALSDHDHTYGRGYRKGAMTIGLIIHGDSSFPGHGPGTETLLTTREPVLEPVIDPNANIARYLSLT